MNNNLLGGAFLVVASLACFSPTGVTDHSQTRESSQLNLIQPDPTLAEIVVGKVVVTYLVQIGTWNTETQQFDYIKKEQTISGSCFPIEWIAPNGDEGSNTKKIGRLRIMTVSHLFEGLEVKHTRVELFKLGKSILGPLEAKTLRQDKKKDLVLLEVPAAAGINVMKLSAKPPVVGARTLGVGCTIGQDPIFTEGFICSKPMKELEPKKSDWLTSTQVYFGSSGGVVIYKGTNIVAGMTRALFVNNGNVVYHVQFMTTSSSIKEWLDNG